MASLADVRGVRPGVPFRRGVSYAGEYKVPLQVFESAILRRWPDATVVALPSGCKWFTEDHDLIATYINANSKGVFSDWVLGLNDFPEIVAKQGRGDSSSSIP